MITKEPTHLKRTATLPCKFYYCTKTDANVSNMVHIAKCLRCGATYSGHIIRNLLISAKEFLTSVYRAHVNKAEIARGLITRKSYDYLTM